MNQLIVSKLNPGLAVRNSVVDQTSPTYTSLTRTRDLVLAAYWCDDFVFGEYLKVGCGVLCHGSRELKRVCLL